jgi:hypothetical protein
MKGRIGVAVVLLAASAVATVGAALATPPSGLVGTPLARGAAGAFDLHDTSQKLKLQAKEPIDVAFVKATLGPNGFTGWHGHTAPSLVVVSAGSMTVIEVHGGECVERTYAAGSAFVHSEDAHNFVAGPNGAEFYIAYLLPAGASPAPIDVTPAPAPCD